MSFVKIKRIVFGEPFPTSREAHERLTGAGNELVLDNLRRLASAGRDIVIRVPIVPGFNDDEENLEATGRFVASLDAVNRIDLLPYNRGGRDKAARLTDGPELLEATPPDHQRLSEVARRLRDFGFVVGIGG